MLKYRVKQNQVCKNEKCSQRNEYLLLLFEKVCMSRLKSLVDKCILSLARFLIKITSNRTKDLLEKESLYKCIVYLCVV